MKAALLIKQWPIWCIANIYNTGRLISIISEAGGMQGPAEIHSLGCVRNQAEEECIPVERSLDREQQESDPVASCDANILWSSWTSNICEVFFQVKHGTNLVCYSQLFLWKHILCSCTLELLLYKILSSKHALGTMEKSVYKDYG